MKLFCGKCGKECNADELRVCSDCGSFLCEHCSTENNELCPDCYGRLNRLS